MTLNRHKHPLNPYLLFVFILLEALTVAFIVTFRDVYLVLQDFILTHAVFPDSTVYTLQSKRDCSKFGAGLFSGLWILFLSGILKVFCYGETAGRGFCVCVLNAQLRPALCNPRDCSPPGSSVYGVFQARILEWFAVSFSRGPS